MSREKQRQLEEINRPRNEELFNGIEKQYQEIAKIKAESVQVEEMALELCRPRNIVKMIHHRTCGNCDTSSCDIYELCVDLYNAGYRKQSENVIELPCKVGDKVYFNYVELNEICPAKVIGIHNNYYTPSMPWWVTIEYESQLIGRHEVKIAVDVFNLVCHKTKEEAEAKMKGGAE